MSAVPFCFLGRLGLSGRVTENWILTAATEEPINDELCDFHAAGAPLTDYTADVAPTLESMLSGIKKDK